jgi:peptidoglycan/xylan/chitin deacetylase (PgdA/CDA1 family)
MSILAFPAVALGANLRSMHNSIYVLKTAAVAGLIFGVALLSSTPVLAGNNTIENEIAYRRILTAEDPNGEVFFRSLRITRIRSVAQTLLKEFDSHLDDLLKTKSGEREPFLHPSYARLIAARELKDREEEVLEYSLERSQDVRAQAGLTKVLRDSLQQLDQQSIASAQEDRAVLAEIDALVPKVRARLIEPQFAPGPNASPTPPNIRGFKEIFPSAGFAGFMSGSEYKQGRWSITYDDGPSSDHTLEILKVFKDARAKASFFWLARNAPRHPDVVAEVRKAGMTLANHSYNHSLLTKGSDDKLQEEIVQSQEVLTKVFGFAPNIFRCPYGGCGPDGSQVRTMIADQNMISVIWNIDSLDWQDRNTDTVYERVKKQMALRGRGIILFHDIHPQSIAASRKLLADLSKGLKNKSQRVLTVQTAISELSSPGGMK